MTTKRALILVAAASLTLAACGDDGGDDTVESADTVAADTSDTASDTVPADTDAGDDGDDGSDDGASAGGLQEEAAQRTIDSAAAAGVVLDEECVREVAAELSDADAEAIASGNDADVSADGDALSARLVNCADPDVVADLFIEGMEQSGQEFDEACVREKIADVDMAEVVEATQGGQPPADLIASMVECMDLSGG